ncbi:complement factor H-like [Cololabis saira]|uniref:complement factor H-like n=1 Tax=Cololabis saira TaxID=129043 RepID=UPI002AD4E901|nr:complement factor H-like [Cololabis saira]
MQMGTKTCVLLLWIQTLSFVKCQKCTRQQFRESSDYDSKFDTTVLDSEYPNGKQPLTLNYHTEREKSNAVLFSSLTQRCPLIHPSNKVQVIGDHEEASFGNVIRFSCKSSNQILDGANEIYCNENGEWSGEVPDCKDITCDTPVIEHGSVRDAPREYKENEILNFDCGDDYKRTDERFPTCIKLGGKATWSPTPGCKLKTCELELQTGRGTTYIPSNKNVFLIGSTLQVKCGRKHWIVDSQTTTADVTCKSNGEWSIRPVCKEVICSDPQDNAVDWFDLIHWGRNKLDETARYACRAGFEKPRGTTTATCTRAGWRPDPLCKRTWCSRPDLENARVTWNNRNVYSSGDYLRYTCINGDDRAFTLTCDEGSWTGLESCSGRKVHEGSTGNVTDVGGKREKTVQYDAEAFDFGGDVDRVTINGDIERRCGLYSETNFSWGAWFSGDVELSVISITVKLDSKVAEDVTKGEDVYNEEKRSDTRDPSASQAFLEYGVGDGIEGGTEVEEDKDGEKARICCQEEVIGQCERLQDEKLTVNVSMDKDSYKNGEVIEYVCKAHDAGDKNTATCVDGQWTTTVECPVNLSLIPIDPYDLQGSQEIEYLDSGDFTVNDLCPSGCQNPPNLADGDVKESMKPEYDHNESVEYMCQRYYIMEGTGQRTCVNGAWTGEIKCLKPCTVNQRDMDERNIRFAHGGRTKMYLEHKDHIRFVCKHQRQVSSVPLRQQCVDGVMELPTCRDQY